MSVDEVMSDLQTPWREDPKPQRDCISRQAMIEEFEEWANHIAYAVGKDYSGVQLLNLAICKIKRMPSVQPDIARDIATIIENEKDMRVINAPSVQPEPQRMRGKWHLTDAYPHWLCCDQCHKKMLPNAEWVELYNIPTNFCPNCGADMREHND